MSRILGRVWDEGFNRVTGLVLFGGAGAAVGMSFVDSELESAVVPALILSLAFATVTLGRRREANLYSWGRPGEVCVEMVSGRVGGITILDYSVDRMRAGEQGT